jgi:GntR family transcriptional repressor for pyruvate dehydrogenase complex
MTPFDKMPQIKFKSKGAIIAEELLARIKSGEYAAGTRLPAERLISEQMGVSRPSVREAISALQIVGIIKSRPGDGSYIAENLAVNGLSLQVAAILEQSDSPYEILQARMAIETGAIRLAIREATDEDIQKVKDVWQERLRIGRAGDFQVYTKMGKELHLSIARATQNRIIISVVDRLLNITDQPLWQNMRKLYYQKDPGRIEQMLAIHDRIVHAVQERDSREAILALEEDFSTVIEQLYSLDRDKE